MLTHFLKCDKKALSRAFLLSASIVSIIGIASSYLWTVQSPLFASFNNEVVSFSFFFFLFSFFFFKKIAFSLDEFSILSAALLFFSFFGFFYLWSSTNTLIHILYVLNFLIFYSATKELNKNNAEEILNVIFAAILLASTISIFIGIFQWLGYANIGGEIGYWIYPATNSRISSNLAQPNNLATLLILGIVSANYFSYRKKYYNFLLIYILLSTFCIVLTGSRTPYISLFLIGLLSSLVNKKDKKLFLISWTPLFYFILLSFTYDNWNLISPLDFPMDRDRGIQSGRFLLWQMALEAISEKPLLGYGLGNLIFSFKQVIPLHLNFSENSVPTSSHNIFLDYAIYFGLPFVIFSFFLILRGLKKSFEKNESLNFFCLLGITPIAAHAMLEYPQNYAYFLLPLAVFLGGAMHGVEESKRSSTLFFKIIFLVVFVISCLSIKDYYKVEDGFKKIRLQKNGVLLNNEYKRPDFCILLTYCNFLDVHLLSNDEINGGFDINREKLSDVMPTPFTMELGIFSLINRGEYSNVKNEITNYCLFFGDVKCNYLKKRIKYNFPFLQDIN